MFFLLHIDGDITLNEVSLLFRSAGYHLKSDGAGRTIVSRVPKWLQREEAPTNVVPLKTRVKRVRG